MSALLQKRTNEQTVLVCPLSAKSGLMHRKQTASHQAKRASVDDVICSHQHCWRYCQTECFHRLLVNDETEAGWLLEWQIGGAGPPLDPGGQGPRAVGEFSHNPALRHRTNRTRQATKIKKTTPLV